MFNQSIFTTYTLDSIKTPCAISNQILKYGCCRKVQVNNNKVEVHIFEWSHFEIKIEMCDIYLQRQERE